MTPSLTAAVRRALREAPVSLRTLAAQMEVSPALLSFISLGRRQATPAVGEKLLAALEALEQETHTQVVGLRQALQLSLASAPRPRPRRRTRS